MEQYLPVVALAVLGVLFGLLSLLTSRLLAPSRPFPAKTAPYESGISEQMPIPRRFPVKFYLVAMLFIMFDIEIIFLYPWATQNDELGLFGLLAMLMFAGIFFVSFVYELATGGLNWGPSKAHRAVATSAFAHERAPIEGSTASGLSLAPAAPGQHPARRTVRQVGLEGRELDEPRPQRTRETV